MIRDDSTTKEQALGAAMANSKMKEACNSIAQVMGESSAEAYMWFVYNLLL